MSELIPIVVIDDERLMPAGSLPVRLYRNSKAGLEALEAMHARGDRIIELWLDHDLGEDDAAQYGYDTIMPVVFWLEEKGWEGNPLLVDTIVVHSMNISAVPSMMAALRPYYTVIRDTFPR